MKKVRNSGFTLIEMVIVMLVVGILALTALPSAVSGLRAMRSGAAAEKMMSDIRYIRRLSLSRHSPYGIEIKQSNNAYELFSYNAASNTKTLITDPHTGKNMVVDFDQSFEFSGVQVVAANCCAVGTCAKQSVIFDAFGVPMDDNEAVFTTPATITLNAWSSSSGDATARTVTIHETTAFTETV